MQRIARVPTHSNATHVLRALLIGALCFAGCTASVGQWPEGTEEPVARDQNVGTSLPSDQTSDEENDDNESDSDAGTPGSDEEPEEEPAGEEPVDEEEPADECAQAAIDGPAVIQQLCAGCHAASPGLGGFNSAESASAMVEAGVVVANSASTSRIFIRMSEGTMPPSGLRTEEDVAKVEAWINCGAP